VTSGVARSRAGVKGSPHSSQVPCPPPRSRSSASASLFASSMKPTRRCRARVRRLGIFLKGAGELFEHHPSPHAADEIQQVA
jgi:hypothetical protein